MTNECGGSQGSLRSSASPAVRESGHERLGKWFGLSRASWLTLPRVLMEAMPEEWQGQMADLLEEACDTFPNADVPSTYVSAKRDGKFCKMPEWLGNYRRPDSEKIRLARAQEPTPNTETGQ